MFLSNWLVLQIVAAGVTGAVEYPSAADFFMNFDSNNRLYFSGGSKDYVSNLILYKGETEYPVYNGSVSNIYISDPASYVSYIQLCNETYVTNTVDVQTIVNPEGAFPDTETTSITGYATSDSPSQGSMGSYIDFSGDGTRMVVGMGRYNSGQGRAAVYHLENGSWVRKVDLAPTASSTRFGDSVLMNEDGTRIAVNYYPNNTIKIYEYTNGAWPTSPTTSISGTFGSGDMDWNTDGTVLAVAQGEGGNNAYIYTRDSGTGNWSLTKTWSGAAGVEECIAINGAGTRIILGATRSSGTTDNWNGSIHEANYDSGTSTWSSLTEVGTYNHTGNTKWPARLRMNNDGTRLIALGQATDASDTNIWHRQSGTSWTKTFDVPGRCSIYSRGSGSISYDGNMVLTGDNYYAGTASYQGRAYLYEYANGSWSLTKTYENPKTTPVANDYWGYGTAITKLKDRIAIGMTGDDTAGTDYGSLYIYDLAYSYPRLTQDNYNKLSLTSLTPTTGRITFNSNTYEAGAASDFYVSEAGTYEVSAGSTDEYAIVKKTVSDPINEDDTVIVGYDFSQLLSTEQKIVASDKQASDVFGHSVSISGDYAIVGAYGEDTGGTNAGAAYIYKRDPSTGVWGSEQKIQASDKAADDQFGHSVSLSGDYAIVGARYEDPNNINNAGAAYIYVRNTSTGAWFEQQKIQAGDKAADDQFGYSVSISGGYAIVGARLEDTGGTNAGAAYIYTRDPTTGVWGSEQKIQASDKQASDQFGYSVSISGDYAIVGAYAEDTGGTDAGAAYMYKRDPTTGVWGSEQKIQASDKQASDQFGYSVSISGGYAIVGARLEDTGGTDAGAAYMYKRDPSTGVWGSEQKIQASDRASQDQFGWSVSISGGYAIVGARLEDTGGTDAGAAYMYKRDPSTGVWGSEQKIQASDKATQDYFGWSVSISGGYAIVGARGEDTGGTDAGAAYIYEAEPLLPPKLTYDTYNKLTLSNVSTSYSSTLRYDETKTYDIGTAGTIFIQDPGRYEIATTDSAIFLSLNSNVVGTVTQADAYDYSQAITTEQKLTASDRASQDNFGESVSLSGDYAIVGARYEDPNNINNAGAAYIYVRNTSTGAWFEQQKIQAGDKATNDAFGYSVSLSGDYAIVGAYGKNSSTGAAYIYTRDPSTGQWGSEYKITASDRATSDLFGRSVSLSGDYAIVGAFGKNSSTGAAYIYTRSGTTWGNEYKLTASDAASQDYFGISVSLSGDYAIVGAPYEDANGGVNDNYGAAYIYTRSGTSWGSEQKIQANDKATGDQFGYSVSISGDYAIVGANGGNSGTGAAYIYTRIGTTWGNEYKLTASDATTGDSFGQFVSISGDYAIVGAGNKNSGTGAAYVYKRDASTGQWGSEQKLTASDAATSDEFGYSVSISDMGHAIVGARYEDPDNIEGAGAAYVYTAENLVSTLGYDGLNTLVLSNVSTGSYNTLLEGSNVLACGTDLTTYPVPKSGITGTFTYSARTKSDSVYAFTNDVSITDYYKLYQYPPIDGTTSGLTESAAADTWSTWTISGAANGNGSYKAKTTHATDGTDYCAYRAFNNDIDDVAGQLVSTTKTNFGLTLELPSAKTIRKYIMYPVDHTLSGAQIPGSSTDPTLPGNGGQDYKSRPGSWILKGSNDGTNWTDLDTVTNQPPSIYGDVHSIDSPASYLYYQLSVVTIVDTSADRLRLGEWQLWGDA